MATNLAELRMMVDHHTAGTYNATAARGVPMPEDVPLGNEAELLTATAMFIDIRQSSDITNAFRRQTAAKMLKSYFDGAVRLIRHHDGAVRSFNGDGMLALFTGEDATERAVLAGMQVKWFIEQVLWPKFDTYFDGNEAARGQPLAFSVGCGIDRGDIYAVRVGIRGTNDVAWVGKCTNTAAKLAGILHSPDNIAVTGLAYKKLSHGRKFTTDGRAKWSALRRGEFGGVERQYRTTRFRRKVD